MERKLVLVLTHTQEEGEKEHFHVGCDELALGSGANDLHQAFEWMANLLLEEADEE